MQTSVLLGVRINMLKRFYRQIILVPCTCGGSAASNMGLASESRETSPEGEQGERKRCSHCSGELRNGPLQHPGVARSANEKPKLRVEQSSTGCNSTPNALHVLELCVIGTTVLLRASIPQVTTDPVDNRAAKERREGASCRMFQTPCGTARPCRAQVPTPPSARRAEARRCCGYVCCTGPASPPAEGKPQATTVPSSGIAANAPMEAYSRSALFSCSCLPQPPKGSFAPSHHGTIPKHCKSKASSHELLYISSSGSNFLIYKLQSRHLEAKHSAVPRLNSFVLLSAVRCSSSSQL